MVPHRAGWWLPAFGLFVCFLFSFSTLAEAQTKRSLLGRVTDAAGEPLASVRIGVIDQTSAEMREIQTDSSGRFRVDSLETGRRYRVVATKFGFQASTLESVAPGQDEIRITLTSLSQGPVTAPRANPPAPREPSPTSDVPTFKVDVSTVLLNVSVRDAAGAPVPNLKQSDFSVYEDNAPQTIIHFEEENTPLSVLLLMDASSSMEGTPLHEAKRAALEFLAQSHPQNEIALMAFNDRVHLLQPFTQDHTQVRSSINQLRAHGGTALYDAVARAVEMMPSARYRRHFVVLFSDGKDADSGRKFSEIDRLVQSSDVVLFAVGEYSADDRKLFMTGKRYYKEPALEVNYNPVWVLRQLTDLSGGKAFFPQPNEPLATFFALIARELHHQYVLGYAAPPASGEPKFRAIEVRVETPHSGPITVRTRRGYLTPGARSSAR